MDAIESGIVKIPRASPSMTAPRAGTGPLAALGQHQPSLPKRRALKPCDLDTGPQGWLMPETPEGAPSLYRSYEQNYGGYEARLEALGEPPPVLIVVCPNTIVSKLVFDWIAGATDLGHVHNDIAAIFEVLARTRTRRRRSRSGLSTARAEPMGEVEMCTAGLCDASS